MEPWVPAGAKLSFVLGVFLVLTAALHILVLRLPPLLSITKYSDIPLDFGYASGNGQPSRSSTRL